MNLVISEFLFPTKICIVTYFARYVRECYAFQCSLCANRAQMIKRNGRVPDLVLMPFSAPAPPQGQPFFPAEARAE